VLTAYFLSCGPTVPRRRRCGGQAFVDGDIVALGLAYVHLARRTEWHASVDLFPVGDPPGIRPMANMTVNMLTGIPIARSITPE